MKTVTEHTNTTSKTITEYTNITDKNNNNNNKKQNTQTYLFLACQSTVTVRESGLFCCVTSVELR